MVYPIFGMYAAKTGMIAIDRGGAVKALKDMTAKAKARTDEGRSIVVFPEGTRVVPRETEALKPGVAFLYGELDLPCVPIALNTGLCWPAKGIMRYPGTMTVRILPPIEPGQKRKTFMANLDRAITQESAALLPADDHTADAKWQGVPS